MGGRLMWALLCSLALASCASAEFSQHRSNRNLLAAHRYKDGDPIKMYANKVGPFHNPSETYQYYRLPFCQPTTGKRYKPEDLGEVLEGDRLVSTAFKIGFRQDIENESMCEVQLSPKQVKQFENAVEHDYYYQLFYDDLPIWGFIGKKEQWVMSPATQIKYFLFAHIHFDILYHDDRVIQVDVSTDPSLSVDLNPPAKANATENGGVPVTFSYSAKWQPTDIPYEKRMQKYSEQSFLPQHMEIHWFSIINSCVTVLLLTGFLATILMRFLRNDLIKFTKDEEAAGEGEDTGWKFIHGDVFRFPRHVNLLSACLGTGTQILIMTLSIFALAHIGAYRPYNRGALLTSCVVLYALTAGIAGYVSGRYYKMLGGTAWVQNVLLTASLLCGPMLATFSVLNTIAIAYRSTAALPFGTICIIVLLWAAITFPLTVCGGIAAKNRSAEFGAPCRTTKYPRDIPPLGWYRSPLPQAVMAGFLPFSAIWIELYYIFMSVWGHKVYTIYSILFIVFVILIIVTAFISVALTYFQLMVEDHRWWWRSVLNGGFTAVYILGYCFFYYFARSTMSGFMQTSFFFGYMSMICFAFFLMLGTVGFHASLIFIRYIYRSLKLD